MKSIMLSIKPKYCEMIANGKKTVEVRKNRPKAEAPFKVYIYCTKPSKSHQTIYGCMVLNSDELYRHPKEGIKYGDSIELMCCKSEEYSKDNFLNGKVIGEFLCTDIYLIKANNIIQSYFNNIHGTCLTDEELCIYANDKDTYGWQISNLVIYDKAKTLEDFARACIGGNDCPNCRLFDFAELECTRERLRRPPQSWCYVEELGGENK